MRPIKHGSTDQGVVIRIVDSADGTPETGVVWNTSGIDLWYRREGAVKVSITEASLSALNDAHSDGGILHIGDGYYRLDLPDAAFASGATGVLVGGTVTDMVVIGTYVPLVAFDPQDAASLGLSRIDAAVSSRQAEIWASASSTVNLSGTTVSDVTTKTGFKLASDGLDSISTTAPSGVASNFREMLVQVWRRFFKRTVRTSTQIKTYADNGTSVLTTQTYTSTANDDDVGAAS